MTNWQAKFDDEFNFIGINHQLEGLALSEDLKDFISNLITEERKAERERVIEALRLEAASFEDGMCYSTHSGGNCDWSCGEGYNQAVTDLEDKIAELNQAESGDNN